MKAWPFLAIFCFSAIGCSQATTETEVFPDGRYIRRIELSCDGTSNDDLDHWFRIPSSPDYVGERTLGPEETVTYKGATVRKIGPRISGGIVLVSDGRALTSNVVAVTQPQPGVYVYRETLDWVGRLDPKEFQPSPQTVELVKRAIGDPKVSAVQIRVFARDLMKCLFEVLLGPFGFVRFGDQNEEEAERAFHRALKSRVRDLVETTFSGVLEEARRGQLVEELTSKAFLDSVRTVGDEEGHSSDTHSCSVSVSVRLPGNLTETNGTVDPQTGRVRWRFLDSAIRLEPIELYAKSTTK